MSAAARELGVSRQEAQRAVKIAENTTPEAKEAAREADRRPPPDQQVERVRDAAARGTRS